MRYLNAQERKILRDNFSAYGVSTCFVLPLAPVFDSLERQGYIFHGPGSRYFLTEKGFDMRMEIKTGELKIQLDQLTIKKL